MMHPVITIANELPPYVKEKDTTLCEGVRPLGSSPEPVRCARCFCPQTKAEWVSCPQEWLQSTGAICSRCGSEQKKESSDRRSIYWTEGPRLESALRMQHTLFSAVQITRANYSKKPKLILGPAGSGRTSLLHAIMADIEHNKPQPWHDNPTILFGKANPDYCKEYNLTISGENTGMLRHVESKNYTDVLNHCNAFSTGNLTVLVDTQTAVLNVEDLHDKMSWDPQLLQLMWGYHNVNLIVAIQTAHSFTDDKSPFFMGLDENVRRFRALVDSLQPNPLTIFL